MGYYIDIHLQPDPEFPAHQLMAVLFAKLHYALVQLQANNIGVVFPGYATAPAALGSTLRLVGPAHELARLMENGWLKGIRDHIELVPAAAVPAHAAHRSLRRVQAKSSSERLRRRQMRRHGLTAEQAHERVPDTAAERLHLPFVVLSSCSTGQTFPVFLQLGPVVPVSQAGSFNAYGLSTTATIPWF